MLPKDAIDYTTNLVEQILARRRQHLERRNDFIQMMVDHEDAVKEGVETTQLEEEKHEQPEGHQQQWKSLKKSRRSRSSSSSSTVKF